MSYAACPTDIVNAPIEIVWQLLTHAEGWGAFYDLRDIELVPPGPATVGQQVLGVTGPLGLKFPVTSVHREIDADGHRILMDVRLPSACRSSRTSMRDRSALVAARHPSKVAYLT
jgi:hypothetical protein